MASSCERSGMVISVKPSRGSACAAALSTSGEDPGPGGRGHRDREEEAVELVEQTARGSEAARGVLDGRAALDPALEQVPRLPREVQARTREQRALDPERARR